MNLERKYDWVLILVLCGVVYGGFLNNTFHYDDEHSIQQNPHIRQLANIPDFFSDPAQFSVDADKGMYRPLLLVSYALNFALGGFSVTGYHLLNLLIHGLNACLVRWLALRLTGDARVGLVAGLLFAVHPLGTEPVNYISSRSDSLAALFALLALGFFVQAEQDQQPRLRTWVRLSLVLALLSKESAIVLPALFVLYDYLFLSRQQWRGVWAQFWRRHGPYWGLTVAYLLVLSVNGFLGRSLGKPARDLGDHWATQIKALAYYPYLMLMPARLNVEHQFSVAPGWLALPVLLALALALSAAWLLWRHRRQQDQAVFLVVWALLALLPVMLMPLNVLVNERRLYLPCAAFCIGLAWLLRAGRVRGWALVGALVVVAGLSSWRRSQVWADEMSLWSDAVKKAPQMPRAQLYLGNAYKEIALEEMGRTGRSAHWAEAAEHYRLAAKYAPNGDLGLRGLNNQGSVLYMLNDYAGAEKAWRQALAQNPRFEDALVNLGSFYLTVGRAQPDRTRRDQLLHQALDTYQQALQIRPNHPEAHSNVGVVLQELGQYDEARDAYARALHIAPNDGQVLKNMGSLFAVLAQQVPPAQRRAYLLQAREYYSSALSFGYRQAGEGLAQVDRLLQANP
ncbi:MAG: tetratricopeptide repeat protein [Candidatus Latescibacteria bacterium]|nr:tetratricopeptide repeat protein [Candidatus Latescibacterota bacterium]